MVESAGFIAGEAVAGEVGSGDWAGDWACIVIAETPMALPSKNAERPNLLHDFDVIVVFSYY